MRTAKKFEIIFIALLLFFFFPLTTLYSADLENRALLLLFHQIEFSTYDELVERASFLGISKEGDVETLKKRFFDYYQIKESSFEKEQLVSSAEGDSFKIEQSEHLYYAKGDNSLLILKGQSEVVIQSEDSTEEIKIAADIIAIDLINKLASALGSVHYEKESGKSVDLLEGEILSFSWLDGSIKLSDGYTSLTRKIEDEETTFYTLGSQFGFTSGFKNIAFKDGILTTNKEQAYFSIRAKDFYIVDEGDFFAKNATLYLGRVPILYLPFFYYPERTFIFNPAFGFDSLRGYFFSTTTELYGRHPNLNSDAENSLTTLLKQDQESILYKEGLLYTNKVTQLSKLEQWALQSDSYMSLLFDTYRYRGAFIGLETLSNLFSKKLKVEALASLAFAGENGPSLSSVYAIDRLRWGFLFKGDYIAKYLKLKADLSYYSDVRYMRDYANRLTSFSLSSLTGSTNFPETYLNDITKLQWLFSGSLTVPTKLISPFVESLKIEQVNAQINWRSLKASEGSAYTIDSFTLPDLVLSASGKFLDLKGERKVEEKEVNEVDSIIKEWQVLPFYRESQMADTKPLVTNASFLKLDYSVKHWWRESQSVDEQSSSTDSFYNRLVGNINLRGSLENIVGFENKISSLYSLNKSSKRQDEQFNIINSTDVELKKLGLSYGLTYKFYNYLFKERENVADEIQIDYLSWDDKSVTRHLVKFSQPFIFKNFTLTGSLSSTLAPIPLKILPKLTFKWEKVSLSASYSLIEEQQKIVGEDFNFNFSYSDLKIASINLDATYRKEVYKNSNQFFDPLLLKSKMTFYPFKAALQIFESSEYDFNKNSFTSFNVGAKTSFLAVNLFGSGKIENPTLDLLDTNLTLGSFERLWWKERLKLALSLDVGYRHSFWDTTSSSFDLKLAFNFHIAQFLDLQISLTTVNKGLYKYASFNDAFYDLLRSFDFFGSGQKSSQFTMESFEISLVHYMADWTLHCKYQGSVVLSDLEYRWQPTLTLFVQWKAIKEIKVDQRYTLR